MFSKNAARYQACFEMTEDLSAKCSFPKTETINKYSCSYIY